MESLSQVQNIVMEHAFTIGMGLLVAVLVAGIAWYWMSRGSVKSSILVNQARVNEADMNIPTSAASVEPLSPVHASQEEIEQHRAEMSAAQGEPQTDE